MFWTDIARFLQYFRNLSDSFINILAILQDFNGIFSKYCLNITVLCGYFINCFLIKEALLLWGKKSRFLCQYTYNDVKHPEKWLKKYLMYECVRVCACVCAYLSLCVSARACVCACACASVRVCTRALDKKKIIFFSSKTQLSQTQ